MARPTFEEFIQGPLGVERRRKRCLAPGCHWAIWRGDMPAAVRDVYGWEVE